MSLRSLRRGSMQAAPANAMAALGPAVWLKNSSLDGYADAAKIPQWDDTSGNTRHATQANPDFQPICKTAIVNGLRVVRFTAAIQDKLGLPTLASLTAGTGFVVFRAVNDSSSSTSGMWDFGTATNGNVIAFSDGNIYDDFGSTTRKTVGNPAASMSSGFHIYTVLSAAGAWTAWLDGTQLHTTATNTVGFKPDPILGSGGTTPWSGDMAELFIVPTALGSPERLAVEALLRAQFATP